MGKKPWYSKPLSIQWELYLEYYKHNKGTIEQFANQKIKEISINPLMDWKKRQLHSFLWNLWYSDASKKLQHLFFADSSLKLHLENTPLANLDGIIQYINENGFITEQANFKINYFPFGIHIPYENKYKGYAFGLMNNDQNQLVLTWSIGKEGAWCSPKNYIELMNKKTKNSEDITRIFRLAINTIAYMEAFPECVIDGVPNYIKDPDATNSYVIKTADKIIESQNITENGKMKSPHFRRGYFKRLSSDFYKNKKGQIVFVSETMVNGKAKTIYLSDKFSHLDNIDSISTL